jgi:NDP-sugar pyrophosphorylase family protein
MNKNLSQTGPTLLVLAAGLGSRYGGSKQLDGVGPHGETLMDYSLFDALKAGFKRVVFVIRPDMEQDFVKLVAAKFAHKIEIDLAFQRLNDLPRGLSVPKNRTKPWGTAHAVSAARQHVNTPFAVINADDFYGAQSFQKLSAFLHTADAGLKPRFAIVGYRLKNTLSASGPVSRAVCETDVQGNILRLTERRNILEKNGRIVFLDEYGGEQALPADSYVSMNMMGFTPVVFEYFQEYLVEFLARHGDDPSAEFLLPDALNRMIASDKAEVRLLTTNAGWFGVTYKEDKRVVMAKIRQLIASDVYPEKLWD